MVSKPTVTKLTVKNHKKHSQVTDNTHYTLTLTDVDTHPDQPLGSAGQHREQRYSSATYRTRAAGAEEPLHSVHAGYSQALMQVWTWDGWLHHCSLCLLQRGKQEEKEGKPSSAFSHFLGHQSKLQDLSWCSLGGPAESSAFSISGFRFTS